MILKDFRSRAKGLDDLLPYAFLIQKDETGAPLPFPAVLLKDGSFMAFWWYTAPDMSSESHQAMTVLASHINRAFCSLGDGWMIHADCIRGHSLAYPERSEFPGPVSALVDEERRVQYQRAGAHFESAYALAITYKPPAEAAKKTAAWFIEGDEGRETSWEQILANFLTKARHFGDALSTRLSLESMSAEDILTYLHFCISGERHRVSVPSGAFWMDQILASTDLIGGLEPRLANEKRIRAIAINGFPATSFPGILDMLNRLPIEYRWSSRFIFLDPATAEKHLERYRVNWWQKRHGIGQLIGSIIRNDKGDSPFMNQDAVEMAQDAAAAKAEAASGLIRWGYYTAKVVLTESNSLLLDTAVDEVMKTLQNSGFSCQLETINALESYLGSLPGCGWQDVRKPLVNSLNFADLMPITSVWAGREHNPCEYYPEKSPPLLIANTGGVTPFRFHLHVGSVGHTLVLGSTGAGKSVFLIAMTLQFRRYQNAQIFYFDKGYSIDVTARAEGADRYTPGGDDGCSFCPLQEIDSEEDRTWAANWIAQLLELQTITVRPEHRQEIHRALKRLAASQSRTLTDFCATLQSSALRQSLEYYTLEGSLGSLLDAQEDSLAATDFQVFEIEHLMNMGVQATVPVLTYLFRKIEKRLDARRPSLIVLDEAWVVLGNALFAGKLEEWLRVFRKRNAVVVFATQTLGEIEDSPMRKVLLESCPTKIYLPNPEANSSEASREAYQRVGLNGRQIENLSRAIPARDYYVTSREGRRMIDLDLGRAALSFIAASGEASRRRATELEAAYGAEWPAIWLQEHDLSHWSDFVKSLI